MGKFKGSSSTILRKGEILMSSENDVIKRLSDLIKSSTPSITRSTAGLSIELDGKTYEIPFAGNRTIFTSTLIKK